MSDIQEKLNKFGTTVPEILLPQDMDVRQWAVIACDQFTQDRDYWEKMQEATDGAASTLNLIFPEVFLDDNDRAGRIENIHRTMCRYVDDGVFIAPRRGFVYIERDTPHNRARRGLVAAVDLERYDWSPSARPLIRPTEGTVPERLPPRMDIRRGAPIETPHIILLINDQSDSLLPELGKRAKKNAPAYQGDLMLNSGRICGWFLDAENDWASLAEGFAKLAGDETEPFLFAVGDGNHSLASAKGIWEEYKKEHKLSAPELIEGVEGHPCRYALVEIENIHDPAIQFEPIHRAVFGLGFEETLKLLAGEGLSDPSLSQMIANAEWVFNADPVKKLEGTEFSKSETDLLTQVDGFFKSIGGRVEREGFGVVDLTRQGIRSSIAYGIGRTKAIAFMAVPEVIKHGKIIDYQTNWKGRGYDTYVIDAPITIGNVEYIAEVIINQDKDGQRFYLHEVEIKEKAQSAFKTGMDTSALQAPKAQSAFKTATERSALQTSKLIITRKLNEVKTHNAKTGEIPALPGFSSRIIADRNELVRLVREPVKGNRFGVISGGRYALVEISAGGIATACLQPLLDKAVSGKGVSIDYIHGEDELFRLAADSGKKATGILLPPVQKTGFFETIARTGPLPRKSFSMGEAVEKRFYIECRKLFG